MSDERLEYLFRKYFAKTATGPEREEFMLLIDSLRSDDSFFDLMKEAYQSNQPLLVVLNEKQRDQILLNVFKPKEHRLRLIPRQWLKYAAAAFVVSLFVSLYFYYFPVKNNSLVEKSQDILPGGNKATLTLANGKSIILDDSSSSLLAQHGDMSVRKLAGGRLQFDVKENTSPNDSMNLIETPAGGQYQVKLPDGSRVWLNSASTLRFPTAFSKRSREVFLSGEAYFEVSKDRKRPFKVVTRKEIIEVLGTHFNVQVYNDEDITKTTLLEGLVKVVQINSPLHPAEPLLLTPGQQLESGTKKTLVNEVDAESSAAWKDGYFTFNGERFETSMKAIGRWYDIEIEYKGKFDDIILGGSISRSKTLKELLAALALTQKINFKITGRKVTITQ